MLELSAIIIVNIILCVIIIKYSETMLQQCFGLFALISITFYSGIGISLESVPNKYLVSYTIFITTFIIVFLIIKPKNSKDNNISINFNDPSLNIFSLAKVAKIGFILFFVISFIYLIYPENRLILLISPPKMNVYGITQINFHFKSNQILYVLEIIKILCKPFYYIHLFYLWNQNKKISCIFILLLEIYLSALKVEYIGRTDIVIALFLILLIITYNRNKKIKFKTSIKIIIIGVSIVPLLMLYVYTRSGLSSNIPNFKSLYTIFLNTESYYPIYYDKILSGNISITPLDYFIWIFTLPIPKIIIPSLKIYEINYYFSNIISGLSLSDAGFSYSLPSIMGEAFIVWGAFFYWVHAIILGAITAITCRIVEKYPQLHFYGFYLALRTLAFGRGGSQGYISTIVNCSALLIIYIIFIKMIYRKDKKITLFSPELHINEVVL